MLVTGICPTFRQPVLLQNLLACWLLQDYPKANRRLIILDDAQTFEDGQVHDEWELHSLPKRCGSLPEKFNLLLDKVGPTDVICVIETDDIYLPSYISSQVNALKNAEYSKPSRVLSDYTGKIAEENAQGRFHSSIAFTSNLIFRIGGWPKTKRADFDQQLMSKLSQNAKQTADPWPVGPIPFIYRWHSGAAHCQSTMKGQEDETWYDRGEQAYAQVPYVGKLVPQLDEFTRKLL